MTNKKTHEVVAAVIVQNSKIFIAQRPNKGELACKWEFPGGKIEVGETHEDALAREINEEFKTVIRVENHITTTYYEYKTFNIILHFYFCEIIEGEMELVEHLDKRWVDKNELSTIDLAEADVEVIKYL